MRRPQRLRVRSLHQPTMGSSMASMTRPAVRTMPMNTLGSMSSGPTDTAGTAEAAPSSTGGARKNRSQRCLLWAMA